MGDDPRFGQTLLVTVPDELAGWHLDELYLALWNMLLATPLSAVRVTGDGAPFIVTSSDIMSCSPARDRLQQRVPDDAA
jgi:hypothetical protein